MADNPFAAVVPPKAVLDDRPEPLLPEALPLVGEGEKGLTEAFRSATAPKAVAGETVRSLAGLGEAAAGLSKAVMELGPQGGTVGKDFFARASERLGVKVVPSTDYQTLARLKAGFSTKEDALYALRKGGLVQDIRQRMGETGMWPELVENRLLIPKKFEDGSIGFEALNAAGFDAGDVAAMTGKAAPWIVALPVSAAANATLAARLGATTFMQRFLVTGLGEATSAAAFEAVGGVQQAAFRAATQLPLDVGDLAVERSENTLVGGLFGVGAAAVPQTFRAGFGLKTIIHRAAKRTLGHRGMTWDDLRGAAKEILDNGGEVSLAELTWNDSLIKQQAFMGRLPGFPPLWGGAEFRLMKHNQKVQEAYRKYLETIADAPADTPERVRKTLSGQRDDLFERVKVAEQELNKVAAQELDIWAAANNPDYLRNTAGARATRMRLDDSLEVMFARPKQAKYDVAKTSLTQDAVNAGVDLNEFIDTAEIARVAKGIRGELAKTAQGDPIAESILLKRLDDFENLEPRISIAKEQELREGLHDAINREIASAGNNETRTAARLRQLSSALQGSRKAAMGQKWVSDKTRTAWENADAFWKEWRQKFWDHPELVKLVKDKNGTALVHDINFFDEVRRGGAETFTRLWDVMGPDGRKSLEDGLINQSVARATRGEGGTLASLGQLKAELKNLEDNVLGGRPEFTELYDKIALLKKVPARVENVPADEMRRMLLDRTKTGEAFSAFLESNREAFETFENNIVRGILSGKAVQIDGAAAEKLAARVMSKGTTKAEAEQFIGYLEKNADPDLVDKFRRHVVDQLYTRGAAKAKMTPGETLEFIADEKNKVFRFQEIAKEATANRDNLEAVLGPQKWDQLRKFLNMMSLNTIEKDTSLAGVNRGVKLMEQAWHSIPSIYETVKWRVIANFVSNRKVTQWLVEQTTPETFAKDLTAAFASQHALRELFGIEDAETREDIIDGMEMINEMAGMNDWTRFQKTMAPRPGTPQPVPLGF